MIFNYGIFPIQLSELTFNRHGISTGTRTLSADWFQPGLWVNSFCDQVFHKRDTHLPSAWIIIWSSSCKFGCVTKIRAISHSGRSRTSKIHADYISTSIQFNDSTSSSVLSDLSLDSFFALDLPFPFLVPFFGAFRCAPRSTFPPSSNVFHQ